MVLDPRLAEAWLSDEINDLTFPKFVSRPPGGVTAWYTMRLTALAENNEESFMLDLPSAIRLYDERDALRCIQWRKKLLENEPLLLPNTLVAGVY